MAARAKAASTSEGGASGGIGDTHLDQLQDGQRLQPLAVQSVRLGVEAAAVTAMMAVTT